MRATSVILLAAVCAAAVWVSPARGVPCNNPMFASPDAIYFPFEDYEAVNLDYRTQSATHNADAGVCTNMNGKDSCCSSTTFDNAKTLLSAWDAEVARMDAFLDSATDDDLLDAFLNDLGLQRSELPDALLDLLQAVGVEKRQLYNPWVGCIDTLVGYQQGAFCAGCDPNYAPFYDSVNKVFKVKQNTCTELAKSCKPYWAQLGRVYSDFAAQLISYFLDSLGPVAGELFVASTNFRELRDKYRSQEFCMTLEGGHHSCAEFMCDVVAHGPFVNWNETWFEIPLDFGDQSVSVANDNGQWWTALSSNIQPHALMQKSGGFQTMGVPKGGVQAVGITFEEISNEYSADANAYAAYHVGCNNNDGLSEYACDADARFSPSSNSNNNSDNGDSNNVLIAGIIVGLLCLVVAGYCFYRWIRKRNARFSSLESNGGRGFRGINMIGEFGTVSLDAPPFLRTPLHEDNDGMVDYTEEGGADAENPSIQTSPTPYPPVDESPYSPPPVDSYVTPIEAGAPLEEGSDEEADGKKKKKGKYEMI